MSKAIDLLKIACNAQQIRTISSATAAITKIHRSIYCRVYSVVVVNPDGSSINIRHSEPRQIIKVWPIDCLNHEHQLILTFSSNQLPLNLNTLSEAERKKRIDGRKPRINIKIEDDLDSSFDSKKYLKFLKK